MGSPNLGYLACRWEHSYVSIPQYLDRKVKTGLRHQSVVLLVLGIFSRPSYGNSTTFKFSRTRGGGCTEFSTLTKLALHLCMTREIHPGRAYEDWAMTLIVFALCILTMFGRRYFRPRAKLGSAIQSVRNTLKARSIYTELNISM